VIANTVAGRTTYMMAPIPLALASIRAGTLRALGVTTKSRSTLLPDVPTIAESGAAGFDFAIWYGIWAPARTPPKLLTNSARIAKAAGITPR